ncbi:GntR family transcriptional regulator [Streptacidiphilus sp. N1-12]|uniref:GntR family transcriptional regulator n=2 Tax=Streptacidiphilus alkalitolerans TaxID=3342712 RepID=A0ABV6W7F4_9ACTN
MATAADPQQPLAAVRERVQAELRERIVSGQLPPGSRLVERELAEAMGVSRVPVREAIRTLTAEGFVVALSPRRVVVRELTPKDVDELFELREALEVFAAGLAAQRATPADLRSLEQLLDQAALATGKRAAEDITDLNTRFHDRILAMADNSLLAAALEPLEGRLRRLTRQNEHWDQLLGEHRQLLHAIASGDPERARACALEHVRVNRDVTRELLFGGPAHRHDPGRAGRR